MAHSSILGGEHAPAHSSGKTAGLLGPSDSSDSGSDAMGEFSAEQLDSDSDRHGTGERASADASEEGRSADIRPDHVARLGQDEGLSEADTDDLDALDGEMGDELAAEADDEADPDELPDGASNQRSASD